MPSDLTREQRVWRWRIFGVTWLAYAGFYLCRKNFSVCMPMLSEDLGYTKADFAIVLSLYSLMYSLGQFYTGMLSDRFGPRLIVGAGLIISLVCSVVMGFGHVFVVFLIMFTINGIAQSTGWPGTVKNMATWFRHHERGVVMGFWCTCYVAGGFIATNFATLVATNQWLFPQLGWRRGFLAPPILLAVVAAIYILLTRNKPSDAGLPDFPEDDDKDTEAPGDGGPAAHHTDESQDFWDAFKHVFLQKAIWVTGAAYFLVKLTRYAFLFWLPFYMVEALGYANDTAGYTSSMYELVGFAGIILAGFMSDKLFHARRFPVVSLMLFGFAVVCMIHPNLAAKGPFWNALGIGLIGMMTFGPDSLMSGPAAQDMGGQRGAAMAAGAINGIGSFGTVLSPFVVAWITETELGWDGMFRLFAILAAISGIAMATQWNYGGRKREKPA